MKEFLAYLLTHISDNTDAITIKEEKEDDILRFNVTVSEKDYPKIIGKHGLTIKSITELVRLYNAKHNPDDATRIYINVSSEEE